MTKKELKRMNRRRLLKLLLEVERENETLRKENETLTQKLENKELIISRAGSIAEASLQINEVFAVAQKAADQYLMNVKQMNSVFAPEEEA
ncbi:MAG: DNA repair protein [Clostridia bacterium]|nr:DNA repair protein [Clostridia bacterium]